MFPEPKYTWTKGDKVVAITLGIFSWYGVASNIIIDGAIWISYSADTDSEPAKW